MKNKTICGIQQVGIGVSNVKEAWKWYRKNFGVDIRIFEEKAIADLMLPYTGGKPQNRHAALAMNLQGGGGFEIWQYTTREPQPPSFKLSIGDLGIFAAKIKCKDVRETYKTYKKRGLDIGDIQKDPRGTEYFVVRDPFGNTFQMVNGTAWFRNERKLTGAAYGAIIGVSDIDKAKEVYSGILDYDEIIYDKTDTFDDFNALGGKDYTFRRTLLKHSRQRRGGFSRLFGPSQIELVQVMDREPNKIYQDRYWGDLGFIHLCYDVRGIKALREECKTKGFPFTVDSITKHDNTFDMGEAAGHFAYIEDPDGTLIEFVETHKIALVKKLGWYLHMKNRKPEKDLPSWIFWAMSMNRIKD